MQTAWRLVRQAVQRYKLIKYIVFQRIQAESLVLPFGQGVAFAVVVEGPAAAIFRLLASIGEGTAF